MNYTNLVLFALGLFGILIHNLIKVETINRQSEGHFNFKKFLSLEWPSIAISFSVVSVNQQSCCRCSNQFSLSPRHNGWQKPFGGA